VHPSVANSIGFVFGRQAISQTVDVNCPLSVDATGPLAPADQRAEQRSLAVVDEAIIFLEGNLEKHGGNLSLLMADGLLMASIGYIEADGLRTGTSWAAFQEKARAS
jgi:hypothetical protein